MLYRKMEKTGDELSVLGFGLMRLPLKRGMVDVKRATAQVRHAIDKGVNYLDTAMPYHMGASETFLAAALRDGYRDKVKIATKLPPWSVKEFSDMDKVLDAQLTRTNTEIIDYYLLHGINGNVWKELDALNVGKFLDESKKRGKIGATGFSFHGDIEGFKEIIDGYDWDFCQIQYNYLDEYNQAGTEGLKYAADKGLGVIIMEPLRGGNLAGKVPPEVKTIWSEAEIKRTPAEWALRWVWNHPEVTVVLSGMNRENHVEENLRIAEEAFPNTLTEKELQIIYRVKETYGRLMKAGCTGCRYCMPCPAGVDIPACFEMYDNVNMFGDKNMVKVFYLARVGGVTSTGKPAYASLCKNCGQCVEKCPQSLPIPELLEDVSDMFDGIGLKAMGRFVEVFLGVQTWFAMRGARKLEKKKSCSRCQK